MYVSEQYTQELRLSDVHNAKDAWAEKRTSITSNHNIEK